MSHRSPLRDLHAERGARFGEYSGWEIVEDFGSPDGEYRAVLDAAAVFDLSYLGKLRVSGRDRTRYLNNLVSNDIKNLKTGTGCYATLLTHQGRMETDLYVYAFEDEFLLECSPAGREPLYRSLNKYIVSDVVAVEDVSLRQCVVSVQGLESRRAVERTIEGSLDGMALLEHRTVGRPAHDWIVTHRDRTGRGGFDLWVPQESAAEVWTRLVESAGIRPAGHQALDWLRTEAGIPWFGADMDDRSLPMEMGLTSAISLTKGCYRGQEIVARITYRGHLDRKLGAVAVDSAEPPPRGARVMAGGVEIGQVTSAAFSPSLQRPLALAVLKADYLAPNTAVQVFCGTAGYPGKVVALPLR